jgi:hypothetical protein
MLSLTFLRLDLSSAWRFYEPGHPKLERRVDVRDP